MKHCNHINEWTAIYYCLSDYERACLYNTAVLRIKKQRISLWVVKIARVLIRIIPALLLPVPVLLCVIFVLKLTSIEQFVQMTLFVILLVVSQVLIFILQGYYHDTKINHVQRVWFGDD